MKTGDPVPLVGIIVFAIAMMMLLGFWVGLGFWVARKVVGV